MNPFKTFTTDPGNNPIPKRWQ